jgi:spoIIIJ-associated protein
MKSTEAKGKTVDEAIFNGLSDLGLSIAEVEIKILEEGSKGIFGLGKNARVLLTEKEGLQKKAEDFLSGLFKLMGLNTELLSREDDEHIKIEILGNTAGILIGRRGETLDAIQYLTSLVVNKDNEGYKKIMIDTEDYRKKREETLVKLAKRLAQKTRKSGTRTVLEPMNPYERRILHATLQSDPGVETYSEGEEPFRRVIIDIKKN